MDAAGAEAAFSMIHNARLEEAAEKRLFCALRSASRMPAAARKCYFSATYGTFSLRSPMAESHGLPSRALI